MIDDIDRIMAVMDAAFDPNFGEAWSRRQVLDAMVLPTSHYVIAPDTAVSGAATDEASGFALSRRVVDEEELLLIAVRPDCRNRGIGTILLRRVAENARIGGVRRLFLEMRDGNPAKSLYLRHGFTAVGRRTGYYRHGTGAPRDAITFALDM